MKFYHTSKNTDIIKVKRKKIWLRCEWHGNPQQKSADGFATKIKSDSGHQSSHVGTPCFPCCPKIEKYLAANLGGYQGHDDEEGVADRRGEDLREWR